jgi:hypothetical protein
VIARTRGGKSTVIIGPERARALLLEAEVLAPEQLYRHKSARSTTADLLGMGRATPGLDPFAQRIGWTRHSSNRCRPVPVRRAAAYAPPAVRA